MHQDEEITAVTRQVTMRELIYGVSEPPSDGIPVAVEVDARTEPVFALVLA